MGTLTDIREKDDKELAEWVLMVCKDCFGWSMRHVALALGYESDVAFGHLVRPAKGRTRPTKSFGTSQMRQLRKGRIKELLRAAEDGKKLAPPVVKMDLTQPLIVLLAEVKPDPTNRRPEITTPPSPQVSPNGGHISGTISYGTGVAGAVIADDKGLTFTGDTGKSLKMRTEFPSQEPSDLLAVFDAFCGDLQKHCQRLTRKLSVAPPILRPGMQEAITKAEELIKLLKVN